MVVRSIYLAAKMVQVPKRAERIESRRGYRWDGMGFWRI